MSETKPTSVPEVVTGPSVGQHAEFEGEIEGITETDLRVVVPEIDGTTFVLQRNAKDERDTTLLQRNERGERDSEAVNTYGALKPEAAEATRASAKEYFDQLLGQLTPEERQELEILVIASDAPLIAPEGEAGEFNSPHKRGAETADQVIAGIREALQSAGVDEQRLLNLSEFASQTEKPGGPVEFDRLKPLAILDESPEFVKKLKELSGTGKKFWIDYELDTHEAVREAMGAEGVADIAERMRAFLRLIAEGAKHRHLEHPGKRLVIWAVSHYDSISPFVKVRVLDRPATDYLPINAGAGVVLEMSPAADPKQLKPGDMTTQLSGRPFNVDL